MGKSSKPKQKVADYYLSLHQGVCLGPVDAVTGVYVGEKLAWEGRVTQPETITINLPDLFGGPKKEGGLSGALRFLTGKSNQTIPEDLAQRLGRTAATCPGFRGFLSLFFYGEGDYRGFKWGTNTPYLKPVWVRAERASPGLSDNLARIYRPLEKRTSLYFVLDNSDSMIGTKLTNMKAAMSAVLDEIKVFITDLGLEIDLGITAFNATASSLQKPNATLADIDALKAFVNGLGTAFGTNFQAGVTPAAAWFNATASDKTILRRVMCFLTDGAPYPISTAAAAATTISDMLNRGNGTFNLSNGTAVDCHGFNINLADTQYTALLDNTPTDGVPVVSGSNADSIKDAIRKAILQAFDSNAAHMIYECMVNQEFGMGAPPNTINTASFEAAAQTFYDEGLGLSMKWSRQTEVQTLINEIKDHCVATIYTNPKTGLWEIKPLRYDYDPGTLQVLDPNNCTVTSFQRKAWGETTNELVVTYTNPENEQDETVTVQDNANIAMQGGVVSDSRNYYGVRRASLAMRLGQRDLRVAAYPVASAEVTVDRTAWDFLPGQVVKLTWPEHGLTELVMRVGDIDYGRPGEPSIRIKLVEDVFALQAGSYVDPVKTGWTEDSEVATAMEFTQVLTAPWLLAEDLLGPNPLEEPEVITAVLTASDTTSIQSISLLAETVQNNGSLAYLAVDTIAMVGRALTPPLAAEATSAGVLFTGLLGGRGPSESGFVLLGAGADADMELALIMSGDNTSGWTLRRGVYDTVPRAWPEGTPAWFLDDSSVAFDETIRAAGSTVKYKLIPRTSLGTLNEADASVESFALDERPHRPNRPANVTINTVKFGSVEVPDADVPVTWANRNRLAEPIPLLLWTAGEVTPEIGQTTTVRVVDSYLGTTLAEHSGLLGSSYSIPNSSFSGVGQAYVELWAERDGIESLQGHRILVQIENRTGWGRSWGQHYGV